MTIDEQIKLRDALNASIEGKTVVVHSPFCQDMPFSEWGWHYTFTTLPDAPKEIWVNVYPDSRGAIRDTKYACDKYTHADHIAVARYTLAEVIPAKG